MTGDSGFLSEDCPDLSAGSSDADICVCSDCVSGCSFGVSEPDTSKADSPDPVVSETGTSLSAVTDPDAPDSVVSVSPAVS